ncbi:hypothetical protein DV735_g1858, partial [Chaetothyriales sp. CBS 134920]
MATEEHMAIIAAKRAAPTDSLPGDGIRPSDEEFYAVATASYNFWSTAETQDFDIERHVFDLLARGTIPRANEYRLAWLVDAETFCPRDPYPPFGYTKEKNLSLSVHAHLSHNHHLRTYKMFWVVEEGEDILGLSFDLPQRRAALKPTKGLPPAQAERFRSEFLEEAENASRNATGHVVSWQLETEDGLWLDMGTEDETRRCHGHPWIDPEESEYDFSGSDASAKQEFDPAKVHKWLEGPFTSMASSYTTEPPPTATVLVHTTAGPLTISLFAQQTPLTCHNFLQLCLDGYYDNCTFHRISPGFVIQTGDPTGTGEGGQSIYDDAENEELDEKWARLLGKDKGDKIVFGDELHSRLKFNRRGLVGMAKAEGSGKGCGGYGSQFFITLGDGRRELDGHCTLFGRVEGDGIYNVVKIADAELVEGTERPLYPDKILRTEVVEMPRGEAWEAIKPRQTRRRTPSFPDPSTQLPLPDPQSPSRSPSPPPPTAKSKSAAEVEAEIAALKQSLRRTSPFRTDSNNSSSNTRKKSALEAMIPETATRGRKRPRAGGSHANAAAAAESNAIKILVVKVKVKLRLQKQNDTLGKDLEWRKGDRNREYDDGLVVIDPREKEREIATVRMGKKSGGIGSNSKRRD